MAFLSTLYMFSSFLSSLALGFECNIVDFGAIGDGETLNTAAFRKTVEACTSFVIGETNTIIVPEGTFLTGSFDLASNLVLRILKGGRILGSTREQGIVFRK